MPGSINWISPCSDHVFSSLKAKDKVISKNIVKTNILNQCWKLPLAAFRYLATARIHANEMATVCDSDLPVRHVHHLLLHLARLDTTLPTTLVTRTFWAKSWEKIVILNMSTKKTDANHDWSMSKSYPMHDSSIPQKNPRPFRKAKRKTQRTSFARLEAKSSGSSSLAQHWCWWTLELLPQHFFGLKNFKRLICFTKKPPFLQKICLCLVNKITITFTKSSVCRNLPIHKKSINNQMCGASNGVFLPACTAGLHGLRLHHPHTRALWRWKKWRMTTVAGRGKHGIIHIKTHDIRDI